MTDDLLVRVDAQVSEVEAKSGKASTSTLRSQGSSQEALALLRDLARQDRSYFTLLDRTDNRLDRNANRVGSFGLGLDRGGGGSRVYGQVNITGDVHTTDIKKLADTLTERQRRAMRRVRS